MQSREGHEDLVVGYNEEDILLCWVTSYHKIITLNNNNLIILYTIRGYIVGTM
jgi:hypothetical protein